MQLALKDAAGNRALPLRDGGQCSCTTIHSRAGDATGRECWIVMGLSGVPGVPGSGCCPDLQRSTAGWASLLPMYRGKLAQRTSGGTPPGVPAARSARKEPGRAVPMTAQPSLISSEVGDGCE